MVGRLSVHAITDTAYAKFLGARPGPTPVIRIPTYPASEGSEDRSQHNDCHERYDSADDRNHHDIAVAIAMRRSANGK
jgi:hypothetical protein